MDRITLSASDIAAIEEFLTLNHNLSAEDVSAKYGWKSGSYIVALVSGFRKMGVKIPDTKRRIKANSNIKGQAEALKKYHSEFRQWKAEQAAKAAQLAPAGEAA